MAITLVPIPLLDEQAARIRTRSFSWESYQHTGQITPDELALLKKIDKQPPTKVNSLLMGEGPRYALLFMSILKKLSHTEPTQAVLVMIWDAIAVGKGEYRERTQLFLGTGEQDPDLPFGPLVGALDSDDEFVQLKTIQILTSLLTSSPRSSPTDHVLLPFLHKLSVNILSSSPRAQDVCLPRLALALWDPAVPTLAWQSRESVKALIKVLKGPPTPGPEAAFLAACALSSLSFDDDFAAGVNAEFDVIPVLVGIAQDFGEERVIGVITVAFKNLATKAPSDNLPSMLDAKLLPLCEKLTTREFTNVQVVNDVIFLRDLLQQSSESLT